MFNIGDYIKVYCTNTIESGKVLEVTESYWVIEGIDGSRTIIFQPSKNVSVVKVCGSKKASSDVVFVDTELKPDHYERNEALRAANLAELYKLRAQEERKRARELLSSQIKTIPEVQFGIPDLSKPIYKHPRKKT